MKKSEKELRILMELRRSNAAGAVPSKRRYRRKARTVKVEEQESE